MGKPLCPTCLTEMTLARVEIRAAKPPDFSTFRCPTCNYTETSLTFGRAQHFEQIAAAARTRLKVEAAASTPADDPLSELSAWLSRQRLGVDTN
jgi:transposase-like protein